MYPWAELAPLGQMKPRWDSPGRQRLPPQLGAQQPSTDELGSSLRQTGQGTGPRDTQPFGFAALLCVAPVQTKLVPSSSSQTRAWARNETGEGEKGCDSTQLQDTAACKSTSPSYLELPE